MQFVEAEEPETKGLETFGLVALQRHAGGDLQAVSSEFLARLYITVFGITDDDARSLETFGSDALDAFVGERRADLIPEFLLLLAHGVEAVIRVLLDGM